MISLEEFRQKLKTDSSLQEEYKKIVQDKLKSRNLSYSSDKILKYEISDVKFVDEESARWASRHNMKWYDSNFFISDNVGVLSNCCRLLSDTQKLSGFVNSIGGTALSIG